MELDSLREDPSILCENPLREYSARIFREGALHRSNAAKEILQNIHAKCSGDAVKRMTLAKYKTVSTGAVVGGLRLSSGEVHARRGGVIEMSAVACDKNCDHNLDGYNCTVHQLDYGSNGRRLKWQTCQFRRYTIPPFLV